MWQSAREERTALAGIRADSSPLWRVWDGKIWILPQAVSRSSNSEARTFILPGVPPDATHKLSPLGVYDIWFTSGKHWRRRACLKRAAARGQMCLPGCKPRSSCSWRNLVLAAFPLGAFCVPQNLQPARPSFKWLSPFAVFRLKR